MSRGAVRLALAIGVAVLVAVGGVAYLLLRDTTTPVDVDEAVERYRDEDDPASTSTTTTTPEVHPLPAEGVYVYATEGQEQIDILGGATHAYPAQTTVTIRHTDCGLLQRWAPLDERWDEEELCVVDGDRQRRSLRTHHEFFGITDDRTFDCEPGYVLFPADARVGDTWSTTCRSGGTTIVGTAVLVAFDERTVGAETVETLHLRVTEESTGADNGPSSDDYWLRVSDGLLIERTSTVDTRSDTPVGAAHFTERFTLRLTSLTPQT